jgi:hypothetical protein
MEGIRFERNYRLVEMTGKVSFESRLKRKRGIRVCYNHAVQLLPLYGNDLSTLSLHSGFSNVRLYGVFIKKLIARFAHLPLCYRLIHHSFLASYVAIIAAINQKK